MIMNVYIGVLSSIYEDKKKIKYRLHARFRAHYTCKIFLVRMVWQGLRGGKKKTLPHKGVWIAFDRTVFKEEQSDWQEPADIQHDAQVDASRNLCMVGELAPGDLSNVLEA